MPRYQLHGLTVDSHILLNAGPPDSGRAIDLVLRRASVTRRTARELFRIEQPGRQMTLSETDCGYRLDFPGATSLEFDSTLRHGALAEAVTDELASVLLSGPALVVLATLRGHSLLHASAVCTAAHAIVIAGPRGCGKSTIASLLSSREVPLFSDDSVRVDFESGGVVVHRGTTTSRLRSSVGGGVKVDCLERSADGRLLAPADATAPPTAKLGAIVFPQLSPVIERVEAEPISEADAFRTLLAAPALDAIGPPEWADRHFAMAADVAKSVPAFALRVPWYAGAGDDHGDAIRREVRALTSG